MKEDFHFSFIEKYFKENSWVDHHILSCNDFYDVSIPKIFMEKNPMRYYAGLNKTTNQYKYSAKIYIGGKKADKLYYGKPAIYDDKNVHYMFPNEARLRNMTYGISIHYDVEIELTIQDDSGVVTLEKMLPQQDHYFLGMFPIMLQTKLCVLSNLPSETRYYMGECKHDYGGYFIIDGKEKVLIPQEHFGDNLIYTRPVKDNKHDYSVEIRSVSEDISKPRRTLAIRRVMRKATSNEQFLVFIPDVRIPVPLFIVMRALGITSDKEICKTILHDLDANESYLEMLRPSIHDAGPIFNQKTALEYIGSFTKYHSIQAAYKCLVYQLLPHVGEMNFKAKACFIGHMVFELLKVIRKEEPPTDRDNYKYKRVQSSGVLMKELFLEYTKEMYDEIYKSIDKEFYYHDSTYLDEEPVQEGGNSKFMNLFMDDFFKQRFIEEGFRKGFKGNWGAKAHTKRVGVIQSMNRLTYHSFMSHLRRVDLEIDESNKLVGPHLLHGSQYGLFDPIDVGGSVGIDKQMAMMCAFTNPITNQDMMKWISENMREEELKVRFLEECSYEDMHWHTKLFINGVWVGMITDPMRFKQVFITCRRLGLISPFIGFAFDMKYKKISISCDEGRLVRPLFYVDKGKLSYETMKDVEKRTWKECLFGLKPHVPFASRDVIQKMDPENDRVIVEYLDNSEMETLYIASTKLEKDCTHMEIHPSLLFGVMGGQVLFPENSALARNDYSCIQGRQAVSLYHTNFFNRIDTTGVLLNYGQKPVVKSRYTRLINEEEHPYGENAVVAIMCHTGYNVEDSILINESAVKRGLFNITYYSMYETYEETGDRTEKRIANPVLKGATHLKPGYNYNELGENGIIRENTILDDKTVMIGAIKYSNENPGDLSDASIFSAKGQSGIVDKVYMSQNDEGRRIVKVRVREERRPNIGDKFSSRCGQKGTIGTLIAEEDMPFTKDGLRPDLIINPHCMPSRMTINQLIECLFCKVAIHKGCAVDSTPFVNQGPKHKLLGSLLNEFEMHSSGNEILYNGMTGEQIESEIYMGPTYYTRLKHMTQDKINYRARGPRAALTRQTNHGRSKDGGLRIGDMERDSILSHGMSAFMYDSMMTRGDYYKMAICNHSGTIAIYNRNTQNFYSPVLDGPLQFEKTDVDTFVPNIVTKYGKEFSIVEVPYCLKLLMHELTSMNVQMRLITAETIDSLTTAGKRSMGEFKTWAKKEPPAFLEKQKIESLLNQPLSDEEYKAITEPEPIQIEPELEPELEEYEPKIEQNKNQTNNSNEKSDETVSNSNSNANGSNENGSNTNDSNTKVVNIQVKTNIDNVKPEQENSTPVPTPEASNAESSEASNSNAESSEASNSNAESSEGSNAESSEASNAESAEAPKNIKKISFNLKP
jgi:DNA-directed RNA polymerase II subunit RPB2